MMVGIDHSFTGALAVLAPAVPMDYDRGHEAHGLPLAEGAPDGGT